MIYKLASSLKCIFYNLYKRSSFRIRLQTTNPPLFISRSQRKAVPEQPAHCNLRPIKYAMSYKQNTCLSNSYTTSFLNLSGPTFPVYHDLSLTTHWVELLRVSGHKTGQCKLVDSRYECSEIYNGIR